MDISVIITLIFMKNCIHITKVCLEGSVSQNFDKGLSFCFMLCRRWNFEKNGKKKKVDTCRFNIRRDIHVQKIKVEKSLIHSLLLVYKHFCHVTYTFRKRKNQAFI